METLSALDSKTMNLVIAAVRKSFSRSIEYSIALYSSLSNEVGPRNGKRYRCTSCKHSFDPKNVKVDHKVPVVPLESSAAEMSLKTFYERCFCQVDNLQVLCIGCHKIKTDKENEQRRNFKKLKKVEIEPKKLRPK